MAPLLTPWVRYVALAGFAASFVFPVNGLGFDFCPIHHATGLPCPGCVVTRAIALISQGQPRLALGANPFVIFLWPGLLGLALLAPFPAGVVQKIEGKLDVFEPALSRAWRILLYAFLGFGILRFVTLLVLGMRFP